MFNQFWSHLAGIEQVFGKFWLIPSSPGIKFWTTTVKPLVIPSGAVPIVSVCEEPWGDESYSLYDQDNYKLPG